MFMGLKSASISVSGSRSKFRPAPCISHSSCLVASWAMFWVEGTWNEQKMQDASSGLGLPLGPVTSIHSTDQNKSYDQPNFTNWRNTGKNRRVMWPRTWMTTCNRKCTERCLMLQSTTASHYLKKLNFSINWNLLILPRISFKKCHFFQNITNSIFFPQP